MEPTGWDGPSTKRAGALVAGLPEELQVRPLLIVVSDIHGVEALSFRNLADVYVLAASELETVDVMAGRAMLVERGVWERWSGGEIQMNAVDAPKKPKAKPAAKKAEAPVADAPVETPAVEAPAEPVAIDAPEVEPAKPRSRAKKADVPDVEPVAPDDAAKEESA
jgi:hypothetical protein